MNKAQKIILTIYLSLLVILPILSMIFVSEYNLYNEIPESIFFSFLFFGGILTIILMIMWKTKRTK